ncbi:MAG: hypothetical protein KH376_04210 [Holdemanella biformis]|uniref:hypothetical protein n=1 Tax=Holdemanella biformis TaxID=1735 RepID=UPI00242F744D|nr:hypothetical protein [Holdemanella biformis]MBS6454939.1 hypothetical protein [Holdemanella biformis]
MKSKRIIVVVVSSIVLCLCLFFIFQIEKDTSISNEDLTLIYEETVSPNKKYVSNKKDIVHYTIKIYQEDKNTVQVHAESNSPIFENTNYRVDYNQKISKKDIQIKWMTLSGSTEAKKSDQLGLANVKILKDGSVVNEKVISFVGKGVKAITDVIG